jgi:GntR family transcriptional regulator, transcriptional repressor for pyruvate dehydrogenase complex
MYQAVRSGRLYEQIVEQIEQRIVDGELRLGDQLPPERDLAEQFGVSRTAVREAVKALREKGLVKIEPGRGTFVTNRTSRAMRHSLGLMVKIGSADSAADLVEVREILEPEIAARAAERASEENLAALREAVATMEAALDKTDTFNPANAETFIEADLDFHLALAEATQNVLIPTLLDSIIDLLRKERTRVFLFAEGGAARGQFHHKRILDAVTRHDPEAASREMRAHLEQIRRDSKTSSRPKE